MSLQVWLPFNGSLENLGLADVGEIDTTNISFSDNGKIGKCLTGYTGFFNVPSMTGKKQLSVAYWIRINTATSTQWLDAFRWYSTDGSTTKISRNEFYTNCTLTGFWFQGGSISGKDTTVGEWHHYAFVIDYEAGTAEFYIDGVSVGSSSAVGTTHYLTGIDFMIGESGLDTSHNDFRLYDHCLSAKEVKELSKGLVAHYPLNDFIGNPNLLLNTASDAGNSHSIYDLAEYNFSESLVEGETYTLSCKINTSSERKSVAVYHSGGTIRILYFTQAPVNETGIYVHTFTATAEMASQTGGIGHGFARAYASNKNGSQSGAAVTGTGNVEWIKIEKGSIATPWTPNEIDSLYSALGLDEGIIYDCSGYNHHGVSHGPVVGIDSPRYKTCTSFDGTNDYIDLGIDTWLPTEVISVAMWVYMDDWTKDHRPISCTQSGGWALQRANGLEQFIFYKANVGYCRARTVTTLSALTPGWHHFVGTYDGYVARIYLDGALDGTSTDGSPDTESDISYNVNTKLFLGCEAATANPSTPYLDGKLSDIRIYATVLSAEDIKALYETSVSIDDEGNFHAYEISEV